VGHAVQRHAQGLLGTGGHGVVKTHALDEAAIAALTRVGDDDVKKRTLLGASAGQSDDDHVNVPVENPLLAFWKS
jgi:hypothetical protein